MTWMDENMPNLKRAWLRYRREVHLSKAMMDLERASNRLEKAGEGPLQLKVLLMAVEVGSLS